MARVSAGRGYYCRSGAYIAQLQVTGNQQQLWFLVPANLMNAKGKVFRTGGDEFICIFAENSPSAMTKLQQNISHSLHEINDKLKAIWLGTGLSFGIATSTEGQTVSECLSLADQKMYQHKQQKK